MAFIKCKRCDNYYSAHSRVCPFCAPPTDHQTISFSFASPDQADVFDLNGTDLTEIQKKMVIVATADVHRKGSHPKRNKAKAYLHDGFEWPLYDQWLNIFSNSTGLEQWPAAYGYYHFEEIYSSKNAQELLAELSRQQLHALYADDHDHFSKLRTKGSTIKKVLAHSDSSVVRNSALGILKESLSQQVMNERKELFSAWLLFATELKEKLDDWKEFNVERVEIKPAEDACDHCLKLKGLEVDIDQVLPVLLHHHPGCRCGIVLAKSEFSREF